MVLGIHPEEYDQLEQDAYEECGRPPKGFDPKDPQQIQRFSERLRGIREIRRAEYSSEDKRTTSWLAKNLAAELHVSPMTVSKYENAKNKSIPTNHLRRICAFYGVSPHYLPGYTDGQLDYLWLEKDGTIRRDENGKPRILHSAMQFAPASYLEAADAYKNLYLEDTELFWILHEIVVSTREKRTRYRTVLSALLELNK